MDVAYINPFIVATRNVFSTMIHVPLSLSKPFLRDENIRMHKLYQVSAAIGLSGPVCGLVVLSLSDAMALALASGFAGAPFPELNGDCFDALAEIVNMIAGGAKKDLPGGLVSLSIPTLLRTPDVVYPKNQPIIIIPFDTHLGRFVIEVSLHSTRAEQVKKSA